MNTVALCFFPLILPSVFADSSASDYGFEGRAVTSAFSEAADGCPRFRGRWEREVRTS